jgi:Ni,Fe-hydrogenase III small subunit
MSDLLVFYPQGKYLYIEFLGGKYIENQPKDAIEAANFTLKIKPIIEQLDAVEVTLLFEQGSKSKYADVRRLLAQSHECPFIALKVLASDEEPTVLLAALSNPLFPRTEHARIVLKLLRQGQRQQWRWRREKRWAFLNLLRAKGIPNHALEALASCYPTAVASNPSTPASVLETLAAGMQRSRVAANPSLPLSLLETCAKDSASGVREKVACNRSAPASLLEVLANDSEQSVREEVASNPSAPVQVLEAFSKDLSKPVRERVAGNPSTPMSLLESLAKDAESAVRKAVAGNPSTPVSVLEVLAEDSSYGVQKAVAGNPTAPTTILEKLASDPDEQHHLELARNPSTPVSVLEALAKNWERGVRTEAALNLAARLSPQHWAARLKWAIQREVCFLESKPLEPQVPLLPADLLRGLDFLGLVFPDDDNKSLTKASRSRDWLTRLGAALHPSATEGILKLLRNDSDADVARAAQLPRSVASANTA